MLLAAVVQILHAREDAAVLLQAEVVGLERAGHLEVGVCSAEWSRARNARHRDWREAFFKSEIGGGHGTLRNRSNLDYSQRHQPQLRNLQSFSTSASVRGYFCSRRRADSGMTTALMMRSRLGKFLSRYVLPKAVMRP